MWDFSSIFDRNDPYHIISLPRMMSKDDEVYKSTCKKFGAAQALLSLVVFLKSVMTNHTRENDTILSEGCKNVNISSICNT